MNMKSHWVFNGVDDALRRLETLVLLAGSGLPLGAVRAQVVSSVDAVVFVTRRADGLRLVETIAEVADRADTTVRSLFERRGDAMVPVDSPERRARRADAPAPDPDWFAC